jgi:hypothetical protein
MERWTGLKLPTRLQRERESAPDNGIVQMIAIWEQQHIADRERDSKEQKVLLLSPGRLAVHGTFALISSRF